MRVKIQKWGNSLALKIPKAVASQTKIQENEFVNLTLEGNKILIESTEKKPSLEDLIEKIDETNLHGEIDFGEYGYNLRGKYNEYKTNQNGRRLRKGVKKT